MRNFDFFGGFFIENGKLHLVWCEYFFEQQLGDHKRTKEAESVSFFTPLFHDAVNE